MDGQTLGGWFIHAYVPACLSTCLSRSIISVHHEQRGEEREVGSGLDVM